MRDNARSKGWYRGGRSNTAHPKSDYTVPSATFMHPSDAAVTIPTSASMSEALRKMVESDSGRLLVTDAGRVVGLITRTGVTRFIQLKTELEEEQ